jgi:ribonuclease HII
MPWILGIDEAGYGPNLGPFVMSSVALRVPEELASVNLWKVLHKAVRRPEEPDDGRLLIEDSKVVYSSARGLHQLERGVQATVSAGPGDETFPLERYIDKVCPAAHPELRQECWYRGTTTLPLEGKSDEVRSAVERFRQACAEAGLTLGLIRSVVVCPARFNALVERWESKGAVLGQSLAELLQVNRRPDSGKDSISVFVDKHGGRNTYAPMLQDALSEGMVIAHEESPQRSVYSVLGLDRTLRLTFQPRADAEHFCVALASMVSKYLREVLMLEFNQFWQQHVPGLKPTAGYPADAGRFLADILATAEGLGISRDVLWRRK